VFKKVNNVAYRLELAEDNEFNATFNVNDIIPFASRTNDETDRSDLRLNRSQEGGDGEIPLAKGPTTRDMARRIPED